MKRTTPKITGPPLQIDDFICRRCRVQATCDEDRICGICKALGQSAEPAPVWRREYLPAAKPTALIMRWLYSRHLIGLNELEV